MADIPLDRALVLWNVYPKRPRSEVDPVKVVNAGQDDDAYMSSWGASNQDFLEAGADTKLAMLFAQFVNLTLNDGIAPADVHAAFMVIPEYRRGLAEVGGIDPALV